MQKRAGREWEEMSGDGNGNGKSGYDVDEEGMKVLASAAGATGAGAAAASKRAKLIGILKPSSARRQKDSTKARIPSQHTTQSATPQEPQSDFRRNRGRAATPTTTTRAIK